MYKTNKFYDIKQLEKIKVSDIIIKEEKLKSYMANFGFVRELQIVAHNATEALYFCYRYITEEPFKTWWNDSIEIALFARRKLNSRLSKEEFYNKTLEKFNIKKEDYTWKYLSTAKKK